MLHTEITLFLLFRWNSVTRGWWAFVYHMISKGHWKALITSSTGRVCAVDHDSPYTALHMCLCLIFPASDYGSWLLHYSLPVLQGILPDPYFTHYCLLVAAMHVFLADCVSLSSLSAAEQYLHRFCQMFAALYGTCTCTYILTCNTTLPSNCCTGDDGCTMNVHLLKHIPDCVRNWGPLWGYSCFAFESMNGYLRMQFHGTRNMNAQVLCMCNNDTLFFVTD